MSKVQKVSKRDFLKKAGLVTAGAAATTVAAPYVKAQNAPIKWRLQTYAGPALAEHVVKNSIDVFNKAANGEMVIDLYTADQLVPQGELFRAVQAGTIDAAQTDDPERSPRDVLAEEEAGVPGPPAADARRPVALDYPPSGRQDQPESEVGGGLGEDAGGAPDRDAAAGRRGDVDVVIADGMIAHHAQAGRGGQERLIDAVGEHAEQALDFGDRRA